MLSQQFKKWDIDLAQVKVLLRIAVKLDSRTIGTRYQMAENQMAKYTLAWTIFSYVLISFFFSMLLIHLDDLYTYFFLLCTYTMTMMAMAVLIEFYSIILYPDDIDILGPQPVSSRTYFIAKLLNLGFYIALLTTALCALPIGATAFRVGIMIFMAPLVYLAFLASGLVSAFLVIYVYTYLMTRVHHEKLQTILSYVQMIFSFIVFGGYQLINIQFGSRYLEGFSLAQFPVLWLTPMAWFAGSSDFFLGNITWLNFGFIIAAIGLTILFANLGIRRIAQTYSGVISAQQVIETPKENQENSKSWTSRISSFITKPDIRVGFVLLSIYLKRDRKLRMAVLPLFGMLVFYYFFFYFTNHHQMVVADVFNATALPQIFSNIIFFIFVPIFTSTAIGIIRLSTDWQASWIYYTSPIQPNQLYFGAYLAAMIWIVFPLWLLTTALFAWSMPLIHAIIQTIFIFILADYIAVLNHLVFPYLPLAAPFTNTGRQGRFFLIFFVSMGFAVGILLLEYFAFKTIWGTTLLFLLLSAISFGLHHLENRRVIHAYRRFEFIEQSA